MVQRIGRPEITNLDPSLNRVRMSRADFDAASAVEGYSYELVEGVLHVAPAPGPNEKEITVALFEVLSAYQRSAGRFARVLWEPRVMIATDEHETTNPQPDLAAYETYERHAGNDFDDVSPALVIEVVSEDGYAKDYVRNVELYARVPTIREYWIVDPRKSPQKPAMAVFRRDEGDSDFKRHDIIAGGRYQCETWPGLNIDLAGIGVTFR